MTAPPAGVNRTALPIMFSMIRRAAQTSPNADGIPEATSSTEANLALAGIVPHVFHRATQHGDEIERFATQYPLSDLRQIDQIVDRGQQAPGGTLYMDQCLALPGRAVLLHQLRQTDDRMQRHPDVLAQIGKECGFQPFCLFRSPCLFGQPLLRLLRMPHIERGRENREDRQGPIADPLVCARIDLRYQGAGHHHDTATMASRHTVRRSRLSRAVDTNRLLKNPLQRQAPVGSVFDFRFVGTESGICTASEWL